MQSISTNPLIVIEGVVSGLQRTTHVSGGETTSRIHITLFSLAEKRIELRLASPPPISDGDQVRVAGDFGNGIFSALACRNLVTGWVSGDEKAGCQTVLLVCVAVGFTGFGLFAALIGGSVVASFLGKVGYLVFLPFAFLLPGVVIWFLLKNNRRIQRIKSAREMLLR